MKVWAISDTHFNHAKIATYCDRPLDFTERIVKNCKRLIQPEDTVIHFGDVFIGKVDGWMEIRKELPGNWVLVPGNHDGYSNVWWMRHGFAFATDSMIFRRCYRLYDFPSLLHHAQARA